MEISSLIAHLRQEIDEMAQEPLDNALNIGYIEYKQLKRKYQQALKDNKKQFTFMGKEVLTGYAKYMLQYIEARTHWNYKEKE